MPGITTGNEKYKYVNDCFFQRIEFYRKIAVKPELNKKNYGVEVKSIRWVRGGPEHHY
jgi:hypothetical protein